MKNENTAQLIEPDKGKRNNRLWRSLAVAAGSAALFAAGCGESDSGPGGQKDLSPNDIERIERALDTPKENISDASNPPTEESFELITGEDVNLDELNALCETERAKIQQRSVKTEAYAEGDIDLDKIKTVVPYIADDGQQKVYTCGG